LVSQAMASSLTLTQMRLSPSSINWYYSKGGDALRLGREQTDGRTDGQTDRQTDGRTDLQAMRALISCVQPRAAAR